MTSVVAKLEEPVSDEVEDDIAVNSST